VDLADFAGDQPVTRVRSRARFAPREILQRAFSRLGEHDYDLFQNNCEHFVNWCRRGVADSAQVNRLDALCRRGSAAVAKVACPRLVCPRLVRRFALGRLPVRVATRFGLPASLAGDAVQVTAELTAIGFGKDGRQSRRIGRRSGALASSGFGYMLGGPAGAAAGFGSWLFGEVVGQAAAISPGDPPHAHAP
jgi:hypothetical protein